MSDVVIAIICILCGFIMGWCIRDIMAEWLYLPTASVVDSGAGWGSTQMRYKRLWFGLIWVNDPHGHWATCGCDLGDHLRPKGFKKLISFRQTKNEYYQLWFASSSAWREFIIESHLSTMPKSAAESIRQFEAWMKKHAWNTK